MSTIKVTNVQNPSAASAAITLDANGQATLNGLAYPTSGSLSGRNRVINGDMRIDQRNAGAAISSNAANVNYAVDRTLAFSTVAGRFSLQRNQGGVTPPVGFSNYLGVTALGNTAPGTNEPNLLQQAIEGFNVSDLGWGTANARPVIVSFWVRANNTGNYGIAIRNGALDFHYATTYTINSSNTWELKTVSFPGPTSGTWYTDNQAGLLLNFDLGSGSFYESPAPGTWNSDGVADEKFTVAGAQKTVGTAGRYLYITGVQLEAGIVATPFERRSYGQELALCQRYYETSYPTGTSVGSIYEPAPTAQSARTNEFRTWQTFKVDKRAVATVKFYSPTTGTVDKFRNRQTGADINVTADSASTTGTRVSANAGSSGDLIAWNYTAEAEL